MSAVFLSPRAHAPGRANADAVDDRPPQDHTPWLYRSYLRFTPLLWLGGVLFIASVPMLLALAWQRRPRHAMTRAVVATWLAVALAQAVCALLNGLLIGDPLRGVRNMLSFGVLGWAFAALAIMVGAGWQLSGRTAAYWVSRLGTYTLVFGAISLAARLAGMERLELPTPVGLLLPDSPAVRFYTSAMFFVQESTLGEQATRLILFHPWPTALGVSSVAIGLISLRASDWRWRCAGVAGALVGVVFSWSRMAMGATVLAAVVLLILRMPPWLKLVAATAGAAVLWGLLAGGFDPLATIDGARAAADGARSGSSEARALIYEKSWEGFLQSPWIGHGWVGESVHPVESLPIGSHSTIYGLLYTGGAITFGCFVLAMGVTLVALLRALYRAPDVPARRNAEIALCLWCVLLPTAAYESIFSLTLSCLMLFAWVGGVIEAAAGHAPTPPRMPPMRMPRMRAPRPLALRQGSAHHNTMTNLRRAPR